MKAKSLSFLILLFSSSAWALPEITLSNGSVLKNCQYEASPKSILCSDPASPNKKLVVYSTSQGVVAYGNIAGSEVKMYQVLKISDGPQLMYQGTANGQTPETHLPAKFSTLNAIELALNTERLKKLNSIPHDLPEYSANFKSFTASLLQEVQREREKVLLDLAVDPKTVEMKDGKTLTCKKVPELPKSKDVVDREKIEMVSFQCGLSVCRASLFGNEKIYLITGRNPGEDYSQLLKIENGNFVDTAGIKSIKDKRGKIIHGHGTSFDKMLSPLFSPKDLLPSNLTTTSDYFYSNMSGYGAQYGGPALAQCDPNALRELKLAHQNYNEKVQNSELIQYIGIFNDQLTSGYIKNGVTPNFSCRQDGVLYDIEAYKYSQKLKVNEENKAEKAISLADAQKLFNEAREMKEIAWNYGNDGCYARAHLMAENFESKGIYTEKAWIKGNLEYQAPDAKISWNYHVAPVVLVKQADGKVGRYVIDPSVNDKPVLAEEWANKLAKKKSSKIEQTAFPFPSNSVGFERISLAFTNTKPYTPEDDLSLSEGEKERRAIITMNQYKGLTNVSNAVLDNPLDK